MLSRRRFAGCDGTANSSSAILRTTSWAGPSRTPRRSPSRSISRRKPLRESNVPRLLQICLSLEPAFSAYHAAWEFTLAAHAGDLATLAQAWDIPLPNKEALRQLTLAETPLLGASYLADNERFSREFARN